MFYKFKIILLFLLFPAIALSQEKRTLKFYYSGNYLKSKYVNMLIPDKGKYSLDGDGNLRILIPQGINTVSAYINLEGQIIYFTGDIKPSGVIILKPSNKLKIALLDSVTNNPIANNDVNVLLNGRRKELVNGILSIPLSDIQFPLTLNINGKKFYQNKNITINSLKSKLIIYLQESYWKFVVREKYSSKIIPARKLIIRFLISGSDKIITKAGIDKVYLKKILDQDNIGSNIICEITAKGYDTTSINLNIKDSIYEGIYLEYQTINVTVLLPKLYEKILVFTKDSTYTFYNSKKISFKIRKSETNKVITILTKRKQKQEKATFNVIPVKDTIISNLLFTKSVSVTLIDSTNSIKSLKLISSAKNIIYLIPNETIRIIPGEYYILDNKDKKQILFFDVNGQIKQEFNKFLLVDDNNEIIVKTYNLYRVSIDINNFQYPKDKLFILYNKDTFNIDSTIYIKARSDVELKRKFQQIQFIYNGNILRKTIKNYVVTRNNKLQLMVTLQGFKNDSSIIFFQYSPYTGFKRLNSVHIEKVGGRFHLTCLGKQCWFFDLNSINIIPADFIIDASSYFMRKKYSEFFRNMIFSFDTLFFKRVIYSDEINKGLQMTDIKNKYFTYVPFEYMVIRGIHYLFLYAKSQNYRFLDTAQILINSGLDGYDDPLMVPNNWYSELVFRKRLRSLPSLFKNMKFLGKRSSLDNIYKAFNKFYKYFINCNKRYMYKDDKQELLNILQDNKSFKNVYEYQILKATYFYQTNQYKKTEKILDDLIKKFPANKRELQRLNFILKYPKVCYWYTNFNEQKLKAEFKSLGGEPKLLKVKKLGNTYVIYLNYQKFFKLGKYQLSAKVRKNLLAYVKLIRKKKQQLPYIETKGEIISCADGYRIRRPISVSQNLNKYRSKPFYFAYLHYSSAFNIEDVFSIKIQQTDLYKFEVPPFILSNKQLSFIRIMQIFDLIKYYDDLKNYTKIVTTTDYKPRSKDNGSYRFLIIATMFYNPLTK